MDPNYFLDIRVIGGNDVGAAVPVLRSRVLSILHREFVASSGIYALAIPRGPDRLRVFATAQSDLDALVVKLTSMPWMRDYAALSDPRPVPEGFAGSWTSFRRYRIPTLKSDRKTGEEMGMLRNRRIAAVAQQKMDYFTLRSTSTNQRFTIAVQRLESTPQMQDFRPDSYGLSSSTRPFSLPEVP